MINFLILIFDKKENDVLFINSFVPSYPNECQEVVTITKYMIILETETLAEFYNTII